MEALERKHCKQHWRFVYVEVSHVLPTWVW